MFFIATPAFWWMLVNPTAAANKIAEIPTRVIVAARTIFSLEAVGKIVELRLDGGKEVRLFYNKPALITGQVFKGLSRLSPKYYFSTSSYNISPDIGVEVIPVIFLPLSFYGLMVCVMEKRWRFLLSIPAVAMMVSFIGEIHLVYLFPILIFYIYLAALGWQKTNKQKKLIKPLILFYIVFLFIRFIWLNI